MAHLIALVAAPLKNSFHRRVLQAGQVRLASHRAPACRVDPHPRSSWQRDSLVQLGADLELSVARAAFFCGILALPVCDVHAALQPHGQVGSKTHHGWNAATIVADRSRL